MPEIENTITQLYAAFNRREIEEALRFMNENVDWPKASEDGRAHGKEEIRAYWTRQWEDSDPSVEPISVHQTPSGEVEVQVHQVVKDRGGRVLSDQTVLHVYTFHEGQVSRMDVREETTPAFHPTEA